MRRFSRSRTQSWSTASTNFGMDSTPRPRTKPGSRGYYTGFPEPFCGAGNTTLRHPDADTSPNASISSGDIDVNRVFARSRRSFLSKHKYAVSYGKVSVSDAENPVSNGEMNVITGPSTLAGQVPKGSGDGDSDSRSSSSAHADVAFPAILVTRDNDIKPLPPTASVTSNQGGILRKLRVRS